MPAPIVPTALKTSEIIMLLSGPNLRQRMYAPTEEVPQEGPAAMVAMRQQLNDELDRRIPIPE